MIKRLVAAVALSAAAASAAVLPRVSTTDTVPNQWTSNMSGVLKAAETTNLPILLVMINDSSSGVGCQHCMMFVNNTLNSENFANIVKRYQFYMVLLNYWDSPREPNYGGVSESVFNMFFHYYQAGDNGYPQVVVIKPDGTRYKGWSYETRPYTTSSTLVYQPLEAAIAELSPKETVLSLSAQAGSTVTVQAPTPGVWTGVVTRSGESRRTGSVAISLEGVNKALYELSASSLAWDSSDGSKTFTVKGPKTFGGDVVSDSLTVKITASGFSGSDISYETSSQTVVFKDSRVKQTLQEFAAAHTGFDKLSSSGRAWYVPSQNDGNVLETMAAPDSTLEYTASVGGILTATIGTTRGSIVCTPSKGENVELTANNQSVRFGVAAGDKITFKASASAGSTDPMVVGFKEFSFKPLTVTLSKPAPNAQIVYSALQKDKSLLDLAWRASMGSCTFTVTCDGVTKNMGTSTSGNALDLGLVVNSPKAKMYTWSVRASYTEKDLRGTAVGTASSKFTVGALPAYDSTPLTMVAYKALGSAIDMSLKSSDLGDVEYSATGLPKELTINPKTGVITGSTKRIKNYTVTVTAKNDYGSTSKQFTLQVAKLPKACTTPKYLLCYFNEKDEIVASGQLKVSSSGKWTASIVQNGHTTKQQGKVMSLGDGISVTGSSGLNVTLDTASKMWLGTASGYRVYGAAVTKAGTKWNGCWNFGMASSSNEQLGGWVTAKVANSGKASFKGQIFDVKISGGSLTAVFPEAFVRANLPRWAGHGDVRFAHVSPRAGINVGCAIFSDGSTGGHAMSGSQVLDIVEGSRWARSLLAGLNGKVFVSFGGGDVEIPIVVDGRKVSFGSSKYRATISCALATGKAKFTYNVGGNAYSGTGIVYAIGGKSKLFGCGSLGNNPFAVAVE